MYWAPDAMPGTTEASEDFIATFQRVLGDIGKEEAEFSSILNLHKLVSHHCLTKPPPAHQDLSQTLQEVRGLVGKQGELGRLLNSHHFSALAAVHDNVANRLYEPLLPQIPHEVDEDEGMAVKIVRMVKNEEPLGATIKCQDDGTVFIARVMKGGVADRSGCIQVGDQVLEVNGVNVDRKTPADIVKLLNSKNGTVTFKLIPTMDDGEKSWSEEDTSTASRGRTFVKALFDYEPKEDSLHPCPEAGLKFRSGDILELLDTVDENWWQGRVVRGEGSVVEGRDVGLLPSGKLEERRQLASSASSTLNSQKRTRKLMYETRASDDFQAEEARTYEEVGLLYPRPGLVRPIILIGSPGVGRNELKRRLLMLNPDRFVSTVPHTSRPPKAGEVDGVDYHFTNRNEMEARIRAGECIEYGEFRGNLYGTLADSVRAILAQGRTPVLNPHPQALRLLRTEELKPMVVLVAPPPFPAMKESRGNARARSTTLERASHGSSINSSAYSRGFSDAELQHIISSSASLKQKESRGNARARSTTSERASHGSSINSSAYSRGFSDAKLQHIISSSASLKQMYGPQIDYVLVNGSLEFAFRELCDVVQRLDKEPAWVPKPWLP